MQVLINFGIWVKGWVSMEINNSTYGRYFEDFLLRS